MSFGPVILGVGVVAAAAGFVTMHASSAPRDDGYGSPSKSEQEFLGALGFTLVLAGVFFTGFGTAATLFMPSPAPS